MKLWGGRFAGDRQAPASDPQFEKFSESFSFDQRLILYDLRVNRAYLEALGEAQVLTTAEVHDLTQGLVAIGRYIDSHPDWARGESAEDIHTWVEARLEQEVGAVARKLRTGRSRNDLVATETRLYVKTETLRLQSATLGVLKALLDQAVAHRDMVMPGYTHLQPAQPMLYSHYLLAFFEMLQRDFTRFAAVHDVADEMPMGAGALAGTTFAIDRQRLARRLGFSRVARNSIDATCSRDFVSEALFACSVTMTDLSRLAEDLIIFSSPGFGYVELDDAYATGSSIMPQKKNPDSLELIRGKTARVLGRLMEVLTLIKGLPLAYDRDLQEDKPALFDAVDTTREALEVAGRVVATLRLRPERMQAAMAEGFLTATDVADELVRRGVPFAQAHEQVGKLVRYAADGRKTLFQVPEAEARRFIPLWDAALATVASSPEQSVRRRNVTGGTAPAQVALQLRTAQRRLVTLKTAVTRHQRSRKGHGIVR
ncbi:MAG TPA: argininosuccinate lyase [Terriglobia bacterium]|nr:argininosuccinate lyase [Terriglobia bacterium]